MRTFLAVFAVLAIACTGSKDAEPEDSSLEADADTDADGDTDADSDADGDSDVEWREPGEPTFVATLSGQILIGEDGHWIGGNDSYLVGTKGDAEVHVVLDGDVTEQGQFTIKEAQYFQTVHNGYAFNYVLDSGSGSFFIDGMDVDEDYIWGDMSGELTLVDTEGGGSIVLEDLYLESWPRYGL